MSKFFFTGDLIKDDIKKIPKFATGGICNDAMFPKLDAFSQIDEIVKDIRDRKDNAMAMEFTNCIGELMKNNGVVPKIKQYGCDFYGENSFQSKFGVIIDELDFSEHDKVFENEIAGLKAKIAIKDMDYKTASELLGKYQQENESLKQRIDELESKENIIEVRVPDSPIEIATHLIKNTCTINELKMIAEHINVYCNGGK